VGLSKPTSTRQGLAHVYIWLPAVDRAFGSVALQGFAGGVQKILTDEACKDFQKSKEVHTVCNTELTVLLLLASWLSSCSAH